jgi:hypothetical protein
MNHLQTTVRSEQKHAYNNAIMVKRFEGYEITTQNNEVIRNANLAIQSLSSSLSLAIECLKSLSNS